MKKKVLMLVGVAALLALTGCESSEKQSSKKVTIRYVNSWGKNYQPEIDKLIAKFQEENPNVKIENIIEGGYDGIHTQTKSDIASGNGEYGDLVICYPDHVVDYIDYGVAVDLQELIDDPVIGWSEDDKEDMIQGFLDEGRQYPIEGTYSVPYAKSTEALFYNADVVVGLDLSSVDATINNGLPLTTDYIDNLTWEEFIGKLCPAIEAYNNALPAAEKIIRDAGAGKITGICGYDSEANLFINLCEQYGYGYTTVNPQTGKATLDFNNDNVVNLLKTFNEAGKKNYIVPSSRVENNSYCSSFFVDQNLLFNIGSTAGVSHEVSQNFDVHVTAIPGAAGGNKHVISQGPSLCILAHPEDGKEMKKARIEAAWKFYNFITNSRNSARWSVTVGYLPVRTSSLTEEVYLEYADTKDKPSKSEELLKAKNAQYSTVASANVFTSPVFKGSSTARTQVGGVMASVLNSTATLTETQIKALLNQAENNIRLDME